jgi:hypothetical protein
MEILKDWDPNSDQTRTKRDKARFEDECYWISVGIPKHSKGKKALKLCTWGTHYLTLADTSSH